MSTLDLDQLRTVMRQCAGVDEAMSLDGDILDVPYEHLGYDSLAVLAIGAQLEDRLGIRLPDEALQLLKTPRDTLDVVDRIGQGR
jgi:act minimal PKS acyl carrier protein